MNNEISTASGSERTIKWTLKQVDAYTMFNASGGGWHIDLVGGAGDDRWGIFTMWVDGLDHGPDVDVAFFDGLVEAWGAVEAFIHRYWDVIPVAYIECRTRSLFAEQAA